MDHLEALIEDLLNESSLLLKQQAKADGDRTVGIELDPDPRVTILRVVDDETPPRVVWRSPVDPACPELIEAAGVLAAAWLDTFHEDDRNKVGTAINSGRSLRIYARPDTGEVALAIRLTDRILELAHRVIVSEPTRH